MQVPLEIAFHNIKSAKWAEELIRARVAELEKIYGRLISCRVRVDQRAKKQHRHNSARGADRAWHSGP
jgi:hypothetical protein